MNDVVPIAMPLVVSDDDALEHVVGNRAAGLVRSGVESCAHPQSCLRGGRSDEVHHDFVREQWATPPVPRDVREEAMLDLVPLARARRQMRDVDAKSGPIGESLKVELPSAVPW